jgi:hypothetical protein
LVGEASLGFPAAPLGPSPFVGLLSARDDDRRGARYDVRELMVAGRRLAP